MDATEVQVFLISKQCLEEITGMQATTASPHLDNVASVQAIFGLNRDESTFWSGRKNEFTLEMKQEVKDLVKLTPRYLYHVHSIKGQRHTRGSASQTRMQPAAVVDNRTMYNSIYDFPSLSDLIRNLVNRIQWQICKADQFSSYTTSLLFAIVHALGRTMRGEEGITISCTDTRKVRKADGTPVEFYYVPELVRILGVVGWNGWSTMAFGKLRAPWYTHEYVVHGPFDLGNDALRQVPLGDLLENGLYDLLPGVYAKDDVTQMEKLYFRCVQLRYSWFSPHTIVTEPEEQQQESGQSMALTVTDSASDLARRITEKNAKPISTGAIKPFTYGHLDQAAILARLFNVRTTSKSVTGLDGERNAVHFKIFSDFVGLSNRQSQDRTFYDYILTHFSGEYPGTNSLFRIAVQLARIDASIGPNPRTNTVVLVDMDFDFEGKWYGSWAKIREKKVKRKGRVVPALLEGTGGGSDGEEGEQEGEGGKEDGEHPGLLTGGEGMGDEDDVAKENENEEMD
ncbi:hypothetical protein LTR86_003298 [Recurvomyces mirabilis]|nr:hypothetical protein LTR86_003298 [Recurvomyces mirabilis]